jgi:putative peptide zinc metalloprotease protein
MPFSHGSGTASGSTRPGPHKPAGDDSAPGARHPNEWLRPGVSPNIAAGAAATTKASASRGNGISKAEVGSAVPYLVTEMEPRGRHVRPGSVAGAHVPQLAPGVQQLGEYQGSGLTDATYLVRNPGGQVVHLSRLLHLVLSGIDGSRTVNEIAARATADFGRTVSAGNVEYLLTHKFAPLGLLAADESAGPGAGVVRQESAILALKVRRTLIPASAVRHIARLFQPLFSPLVVGLMLACLVASDVWLFRSGRVGSAVRYTLLDPLTLPIVLGLTLLSMVFHECGHAAACRYGGARPGVIGVGFYVVWPAFFTNVTDSYRLGRAGRIRTDLGGVYFNAVFAVLLTVTYLATGYVPLLAAIPLVHLEIVQQLLPSLRLDGYFILADLIGVPDLFGRIVPALRSAIPGRPVDPRVRGLKRAARVTLTAWVLLVVPLLGAELTLIILNLPGLARTSAHSLDAQAHVIVAQFARTDVAAGLVSVISVALLVLPMAGLCYVLLLAGRRTLRALIAVNRRRPVLWLPSVAVVLLIAAALAAHWGLLPAGRGATSLPRPAASSSRHLPRPAPGRSVRPARPAGAAAVVLTPVSAWSDENDSMAGYAIDRNLATAWQTQYYLGNPVFGGLKTGSGLILDMGRQVRLSSVTVTFGSTPGADVSIEIGNDHTLVASALSTFTRVATAQDVGGTYTFECSSTARGRYVLIWLTKLPPAGPGKFNAEIFNVVVRGSG